MTGPLPKTCAACGRAITAGELYYRFLLSLQGEQDVLGAPGHGTGDELATLLKQIEEGPEDSLLWEEQVHWESAGVLCAPCRSVVMRMLAPPQVEAGPH